MGEQPGTRALLDDLIGRFPGLFDLGIYNPASRNDDGSPSLHAEGRALDAGVPVGLRALDGPGEKAFRWLYARREELDLLELRWAPEGVDRGYIWTSRRQAEGIRADTAVATAQHRSHIHCGQGWAGAAGDAGWYRTTEFLGISIPLPFVDEEDEMRPGVVLAITLDPAQDRGDGRLAKASVIRADDGSYALWCDPQIGLRDGQPFYGSIVAPIPIVASARPVALQEIDVLNGVPDRRIVVIFDTGADFAFPIG